MPAIIKKQYLLVFAVIFLVDSSLLRFASASQHDDLDINGNGLEQSFLDRKSAKDQLFLNQLRELKLLHNLMRLINLNNNQLAMEESTQDDYIDNNDSSSENNENYLSTRSVFYPRIGASKRSPIINPRIGAEKKRAIFAPRIGRSNSHSSSSYDLNDNNEFINTEDKRAIMIPRMGK